MAISESRVTIHMAASLDGFIARKDGSVDWMEISDEFADGDTMDAEFVEAFLRTIDCYVMGSRTYETALRFEAQGLGWSYGDKPTFVLTSRELPRVRETVEFYSGDLVQFVDEHLRPKFRSIWFVGGGAVCSECLRLGLADEVRYPHSMAKLASGESLKTGPMSSGSWTIHQEPSAGFGMGFFARGLIGSTGMPAATRSSAAAINGFRRLFDILNTVTPIWRLGSHPRRKKPPSWGGFFV